ncbi:MAG: alkaline phosphatase [Saprospiraceae bacterium]|nr:alkaline phosphatase [Saprospiraceae bacterium]
MFRNTACSLLLALILGSCITPDVSPSPSHNLQPNRKAKNIILLIGDGMGLTQITAGLYSYNNQLELERFPVIGLHKSYSSDNLVTDSAAGATAFACGIKTYNGAIAVDSDSLAVQTILEEAESKGLATGLVATSTIVHATPASFIAHASKRSYYEEIAADFLDTEIDLFIGGGKKYFDRRETDDRNIYTELEAKGYIMSDYFQQKLIDLDVDYTKNFGYLTADNDPLPVRQGRDYLQPASALAMSFLDTHDAENKGFFLMVEGAQIDWGGHANDSDYIITEVLDFDKVIGDALDFAQKDRETLVIVTADHETGGFAINPGSTMEKIEPGFTSDYHTAALIPVFAYGPGAELFAGIYENTAIHNKMRLAIGFKK